MGYMVIDSIVSTEEVTLKPGRSDYIFGEFTYMDIDIILLKPLKFMNLSGVPVSEAKRFFDIETDDMLIVLDDVNLPFGNIRLRKSGSDGGHKGLASVIYHLETESFPRLRIGIGKPVDNTPLSEYVLLNFSKDEQEQLPEIIKHSVESIKMWAGEGIEKAMSFTNRKTV